MRALALLILVGSFAVPTLSQRASPRYEAGIIVAVQPHRAGPHGSASIRRYEISVMVRNILYVVLYDQRPRTVSPEYRAGLSLPVLVRGNTITFYDRRLGRPMELPILSRIVITETRALGQLLS